MQVTKMKKSDRQRETDFMCEQFHSTTIFKKCTETSEENLYIDIGA